MPLRLKKISGLSLKLFNEKKDALIGKVISPHGVAGMVKVYPYSDYPDRVELLDQVELLRGSDRFTYQVENAALYGRFWLVKFREVKSRDDAESIKDSLLVIPKEERLPLPEDSFYHDQLVGLKVYESGNVLLGQVTDLITTGGHDLLVIETAGTEKKSHLVPLVKSFIDEINLEAEELHVNLPEGLLEL